MRKSLLASAFLLAGVSPAFATAQMVISTVSVGLVDPANKVPSINSVPGAGISTAATAFPTAVLKHGTVYEYCMTMNDVSFTGTVKATYKITQLSTTLLSGTIKTFSSSPNQTWFWCIPGAAVPNAPGDATLTGQLKLTSGATSTNVKLNIPVVIQ